MVTAGTTNEGALRTLSDKQKLGITIVTARDHAESFAMLAAGKADAFATDDVLLYGIIATEPERARHEGRRRVFVLRSLWAGFSPRRSRLCRRGRARLCADGEERRLAELYNKWFMRRLPTGETLNLPMSPQLAEIFQVLGQPAE